MNGPAWALLLALVLCACVAEVAVAPIPSTEGIAVEIHGESMGFGTNATLGCVLLVPTFPYPAVTLSLSVPERMVVWGYALENSGWPSETISWESTNSSHTVSTLLLENENWTFCFWALPFDATNTTVVPYADLSLTENVETNLLGWDYGGN